MKTFLIFIFLCFTALAYSQPGSSNGIYPLIIEGEKLIALNRVDSALALAQKTLAQPNLNAFDKRQALFLLGRSSFELHDPEASILSFKSSFLLSKKRNDEPLILRSLIGLGAALGAINTPQIDSAIICFENAEYLAKKLLDTISLVKIYANKSNILFNDSDFQGALECNKVCENMLRFTNFEYEKAINSYAKANALMELYYQSNNKSYLTEAKESYQFAIQIFHKYNKKDNEAYARNSLGGCLLYFDSLENAEIEIKESIKIGLSLDNPEALLNGYYNLSSLYEMQDNELASIEALSNLNAFLDKTGRSGDVLFIKEQFANSDVKVSTALIKNKIDIIKSKLENRSLKNEKRLSWFVSVLAFGIILGLILYFKQKKKLLQEEIKNLSKSREIEFMQARLDGEATGRHRIAQQIHDGVGGLIISTKWNLESALEELSKSEQKVAHRLKENLRLQENSYLELRRVMYELERTDNKPWWEALQQFCQQLAQHKNVTINFYPYNLDESATGKLGEEIRLAIQELITNALKHANPTEINIQVSQIDNELDIIVEDNGQGFNKQTVVKGIGMRSIEERVKRLNGNYSIETKEGIGTIVFMDVPLNPKLSTERPHSIYASAN